jgi:hypothetical protein
MPDLPPVHEILAVEERNARKIFERAGDEIIVIADSANARIGMEARDNGISISIHSDRFTPFSMRACSKKKQSGKEPPARPL